MANRANVVSIPSKMDFSSTGAVDSLTRDAVALKANNRGGAPFGRGEVDQSCDRCCARLSSARSAAGAAEIPRRIPFASIE